MYVPLFKIVPCDGVDFVRNTNYWQNLSKITTIFDKFCQ